MWETPESGADGPFKQLFAGMPIASAIARAEDGCLLDANNAWLTLLGFSRDEAVGTPTPRLNLWVNPADRERVGHLLKANGRVQDLEVPVRCRDGNTVEVLLSIEAMSFAGEASLLFMMVNITTRKRIERELKETRELFEALFKESPDAILLMDPHATDVNWKIVACNEAACTMNGFVAGELVGQSVRVLDAVNVIAPTEAELQEQQRFLEQLRQSGHVHFENVHRRKDGSVYPVEISTTVVYVGGRELVLGIDRDVTERKRTEEVVAQSEVRFRSLVQNSTDVISVLNRGGYFMYASPSMTRFLGYKPEELHGRTSLELMHPEEHGAILQTFSEVLQGGPGATRQLTSRFQHALTGEWRWVEWVASNYVDDPNVRGVVFNSRDVTERKLADAELDESRRTLQALFDHSPDGIMLIDFTEEEMPVLRCNEVAAKMNGYLPHELVGRSVYALLPNGDALLANPAANNDFRERVRAERIMRFETEHRRKDGTPYPLEVHLTLLTIGGREVLLSLERDITDRRTAEQTLKASQERLMLSEKLAGLGRLTAGLAHEINTPLAATMNYLREAEHLTREYLDSIGNPQVTDDDHREIGRELQSSVTEAGKTVSRIGEFIRSIRGHTRDTVTGMQEFDAVKLASETLLMIAHQARNAKIDLLLEQTKEAVMLHGEPSRFTQVVTNLVVNGIHACEDSGKPKGSVTVSFSVKDGRHVMSVQDSGTGIPPEVLPRIFDPMFTTKEVGKGTGLGLPIIRDIVTGHFHGEIAVETHLSEGTIFTVIF
ncbi:PAS domain S-box-containing protein [Deinococcus hopiensis KR-140]|uniref:histidine kinase n=1 Tax=Deinococcus hopiensis KR-140 TaxID=695939 RepID=A0A1W1V7L9_9DEIO|nr:PAS domain S-box-containing protein [Deinococcus hopiensis KR-140]